MNLPNDVARCPGAPRIVKDGEWPFPTQMEQCRDCARRLQAVADYLSGESGRLSGGRAVWMAPIRQDPCPERLERKS